MKRTSLFCLGAAFAALLIAAPAASAAEYWATTSGGAGLAPCSETAPCTVDLALTLAQGTAGNTVHIKAGSAPHNAPFGLAISQPNTTIVGEGTPKPVIRATGTTMAAIPAFGLSIGPIASGTAIRNIRIESTSGAQALASYAPSVTISDVEVDTTLPPMFGPSLTVTGAGTSLDRVVTSGTTTVGLNTFAFGPLGPPMVMRRSRLTSTTTALQTGPATLVTDTLARADGTGVIAVSTTGGDLRNVTVIANGTNSHALHASQAIVGTSGAVFVKNSVFRANGAGASDVTSTPGLPGNPLDPSCTYAPTGPLCAGTPGADLTVTNSNFRAATGPLKPASGSNSSADPRFDDAYRPLAGSPLIDAGVDDSLNGTTDLDGKARKIGSAVDIGAFEFDPPAPSQQQQQTPSGGGETQQPVVEPITDTTRPALSRLGITNKVFAVGSASTTAARAKKGTTFVYTLSEPAAVVVTVERPTTGRRSGRSCVKQTRRNRKAKKCTRYVAVGAVSGGTGVAGANALPFSGRIGRKALKPGKYRAALVAVDGAGNRSAAKTVAFKVVRR